MSMEPLLMFMNGKLQIINTNNRKTEEMEDKADDSIITGGESHHSLYGK